MGHIGAVEQGTVFECYKNHFSNPRDNTLLTLVDAIRKLHPDKHTTQAHSQGLGLLRYAEAGHAEAKLIRESDELLLLRGYTPPRSRMEAGDGRLTEQLFFGAYEYTWQGHKLLIYSTGWTLWNGGFEQYDHILTPKEEVNASGQAPVADALIKAAGKWNAALHQEIYIFDNGRWAKNTKLWTAVQSATWDDVILDPAMKDTLINDVEGFFDSRAVYEEYAVPWKRGIILHGMPGCGKTISIKALMNTLEKKSVASLYVKSLDSSQGKQQSIRTIFHQARIMAPCMLVFEDLDSLIVDEVRSYFLNEVDGLEDNNGILMLGSTNHLEKLDPAISKRPSRFDRKYHFQLPGDQERILYSQYWRSKLQKNNKVDFDEEICDVVTQLTNGFSFAYMKELFVQTLLSIVGGRSSVGEDEWDVAVTNTAEQAKVASGSGSVLQGEEKVGSSAEPSSIEEDWVDTKKRTMPEVAIPERLKANPLMRILHKQAKALWKEMDNTADEGHKKPKVGGDESAARVVNRPIRAR